MGKLKMLAITLNNAQAVYYGGQMIEGTVTVELNEAMTMRGLRLVASGGARVHWTEQHSTGSGKNRRTVTRHYSANETYFTHIMVLFGKAPGASGDNPLLSAGRHDYPFRFQLPQGIPSSYESYVGRVRYSLSAIIDRPWRFDHTSKRAFTVISPLDLNTEPSALQNAQANGQKSLCCLCCKSGPISATFRLNRLGYVPGESIPIQAEITNMSSRKMSKSFVNLHMTVQYHATTKTKTVSNTISTIAHGPILPGDSDVWNGDLLPIPPVPPSDLRGCRIIDITYTVSMNVDPSGVGFDLVVPINILIGSIPLRSAVPQQGFAPPQGQSVPPALTPSAPVVPSAPDMPPPSYADCVFGKVDIHEENDNEYTRGDLQFAPQYTYYNWSQNSQNYNSAFTYH